MIYLCTPFRAHPRGTETAWEDARRAAAALVRTGLTVYSPVVHCAPIAEINNSTHDAAWLAYQEPFLAACDELIVVMMPGFTNSAGIVHELKRAVALKKPIRYVAWPDILTGPPPAQSTTDTRLVP